MDLLSSNPTHSALAIGDGRHSVKRARVTEVEEDFKTGSDGRFVVTDEVSETMIPGRGKSTVSVVLACFTRIRSDKEAGWFEPLFAFVEGKLLSDVPPHVCLSRALHNALLENPLVT